MCSIHLQGPRFRAEGGPKANVAVIGTGRVGRAVGLALAKAGHCVVYGSRTPGRESFGVAAAVAGGDAVLVAIPPRAVADFARDNADALAGKLVLDATNDVLGSPANAAALFAEFAPQCRYARAFNSLGAEIFENPMVDGAPADMFFSCAEADREQVEELITDVGLRPIYVGPENYELVDGVMRLWLTLAMARNFGRDLAFRVVTR
ncbi:NAD(P)-binding domain-containing protein [Nocardia sp. NBC_01503]|uniref:NADPH-dependent F420 reductase n=1 Tax=Nocardia sp. NBC_01503 TaxID=2975997 RepID=UPI002E7BDBA7|nr:NAD(P)-binding domain-containing protein [Nocardia sp. NBC_01503]WTL33444.1 NAD(P)-binding domain-containing protein [Nocardia sp. NBC_01503]